MQIYFLVFIFVCLCAIGFTARFFAITRGITFLGRGDDNQKQVYAASQAEKWIWPSDMHKYGGGKTRMKDGVVLCLAWMQRLLKDKTSDYPLVVLCGMGNGISAALVYLISYNYWGAYSALAVFVMYITSIWPWQIALIGGHICLGQVFFLLSIFLLQKAGVVSSYQNIGWFASAGGIFMLTQFSSASTRKFIPLFIAAFLYSQNRFLQPKMWQAVRVAEILPFMAGTFLLLGAGILIIHLTYKIIISAMYTECAPDFLNKYIVNRENYALGHYLKRGRKIIGMLEKFLGLFVASFFIYFLALGWHSIYTALVPVIGGAIFVCAILLLPNVVENLKGYFRYFFLSRIGGNHLNLYQKYFADIGKPIKKDTRGAGLLWIVRYFKLMVPFQSLAYCICLILLSTRFFGSVLKGSVSWEILIIFVLSVLPVLWAEFTRAPQLGRSYFPGLLGQLILIAYATMLIQFTGSGISSYIFIFVIGVLVIVGSVYNFILFFNDVYPARMATTQIVTALKEKGIKRFYTYNNTFNDSLVKTIYPEDMDNFQVEYIKSIQDVMYDEEAVIIVPGVSSKSVSMESQKAGYTNQDFTEDPILNRIIYSRKIQNCSIACFKTLGTSKIWAQESEATSYRDLIIGEINDEDRWRGHAWVLSVKKIKAVLKEIPEVGEINLCLR